jgi:Fe-S-cluster containining protein
MTEPPRPLPHPTFKPLTGRPIALDGPIRWGCSGRGWNCCVDKAIPVRPYDLVRLRHALKQPAQTILSEGTVTFSWDRDGAMIGHLRRVPYEGARAACVFYEEVTNVRAREIREQDPERFAGLPEQVRRAADSAAAGEWRVAGLCGVHGHRPEACRGFPFQRDPSAPTGSASPVQQLFRCSSCALSTPTTPRRVLEENAIEPYWHADDAWRATVRYLYAHGVANISHPSYRALPLATAERAELWASMYVPDADPQVVARYPEQWRLDDDPDGDLAIYHTLLQAALDRVDALVLEHGVEPSTLGLDGMTVARPDLDRLLDEAREALPGALDGAAA